MNEQSTQIRGIDFGTSTSLLSQSSGSRAGTVPIGITTRWMPSVAAFNAGELIVGEEALDLPEEQLLRSAKRAITEGPDAVLRVFDGEKYIELDPDPVIRAILTRLADRAESAFVSVRDRDVVVRLGCPAMWTGEQRKRLLRLARDAGISVGDATLVDEPIAAGVAWIQKRLDDGHRTQGKVLVFDMGGGTLDVAVLSVDAAPGSPPSIAVQSAVGDQFAGDSLDGRLVDELALRYLAKGFDLSKHPLRQDIRGWITRVAREAKEQLSFEMDALVTVGHPTVEIPAVRLSREDVTAAFQPQFAGAMETVAWGLRAALMSQVQSSLKLESMTPKEARSKSEEELLRGVDYVLLAGGMAHVPALRELLAEKVPAAKIHVESDPTQTVSRGLGEGASYERLNLHRPGFDFAIEWRDEATGQLRAETVYAAYTPLYDSLSAWATDRCRYIKPLKGLLPTRGEGHLSIRSVSGESIALRIVGGVDEKDDSLCFRFGNSGDPVVTIEPNGNVFIREGSGRERGFKIEQWPVIRGRGTETVILRNVEAPQPGREWFYDQSGD